MSSTLRPIFTRVRGMATLAVVMILFFVLAMVAAYTNRNLVFEQRTSANSYRSAQALTAGDAGVEWAVAMLNGGVINTSCVSGAGASNDFRTRYLNLLPTGAFKVNTFAPSGGTPRPSCAMTETGWICGCPTTSTTALPGVSSAEAPVVFAIEMSAWDNIAPPGVVQLTVKGCTSAITGDVTLSNVNNIMSCHRRPVTSPSDVDGQARVFAVVGLVSALPVPPAATVTAGRSIVLASGTTLRASNTDSATGLVLHSGALIDKTSGGQTISSGPAGSSSASLEQSSDLDLNSAATTGAGESLFRGLFGMMRSDYRNQPAALRIDCSPPGCTASSDLIPKISSNPTRIIWVNGDLDMDQAVAIGSTSLPAMVVVTGRVTISQGVTFTGVIYSDQEIEWSSSAASVRGAVISRLDFNVNSDAVLAYDQKVIRRLQQGYGSFVRVPGSWGAL